MLVRKQNGYEGTKIFQLLEMPMTYIQLETACKMEFMKLHTIFYISVSNMFYLPAKKSMTELFYSPPNPWQN